MCVPERIGIAGTINERIKIRSSFRCIVSHLFAFSAFCTITQYASLWYWVHSWENARLAIKSIRLRKTKVCETLCKRRARPAPTYLRICVTAHLSARYEPVCCDTHRAWTELNLLCRTFENIPLTQIIQSNRARWIQPMDNLQMYAPSPSCLCSYNKCHRSMSSWVMQMVSIGRNRRVFFPQTSTLDTSTETAFKSYIFTITFLVPLWRLENMISQRESLHSWPKTWT